MDDRADLENQKYDEEMKTAVHILIEEKDWEGLNQLFLDLNDSMLEPQILTMMNEEEVAEYKQWLHSEDEALEVDY